MVFPAFAEVPLTVRVTPKARIIAHGRNEDTKSSPTPNHVMMCGRFDVDAPPPLPPPDWGGGGY